MDIYDIDGDTVDPTAPKDNHYTPNVTITNPRVRRIVNATLQTTTLIIAAIMAADAISDHIDWTSWTLPVGAAVGVLTGAYGLGATQPNIPTR